MLRSPRAQRNRAPPQTPFTHGQDHSDTAGTIRGRRFSWRSQRLSDARGGNKARNRRFPYPERGREIAETRGWITSAKSWEEQEGCNTGSGRDGFEQSAQFHACHGAAAFDTSAVTANTVAEAKARDDFTCESRYAVPLANQTFVTDLGVGLILGTSIFALPLALAAFPQRQAVLAQSLEEQFWDKGGKNGKVEFNRGI